MRMTMTGRATVDDGGVAVLHRSGPAARLRPVPGVRETVDVAAGRDGAVTHPEAPAGPMKLDRYLVISAGGEARVVTRLPALRLDEFCYRLTIDIPAGWGSVLGEINVRLPDPNPTVDLDAVEPEEECEE